MLYGMDISNWQKGIDLSQGTYDFCICKATEGTRYVDPFFAEFTSQLTKLNKLIGAYHFARPDKNATEEAMEAEADYFLAEVKKSGMLGKAILCLDWETEPMDRPRLMRAWLERVVQLTGITPFIYSSKSKFMSWVGREDWEFLMDYGVWIAQWPTIKQYTVGVNPGVPIQWAPPWGWDIWQYTNNARLGDNNMRIDGNMSQLTAEEWKRAASPETEILSVDMKWAVDFGLFKGFPDGTFRENEQLTRGQFASLIRRYDTIIRKENK